MNPDPLDTPAPRRKSARPMDLDKLFDTLQQQPATLDKLRSNSIGVKLVLIPAGTFLMGSPPTQPERRANEGPVHEVTLTQPCYLSVHPITQGQYQKVMGVNPARFHPGNGGDTDHPVEMVSWDDATLFCQKLTQLAAEQAAGLSYRLPTEAEWEYACRAGTDGPFSFGAALSIAQANIATAAQKTSRVGQYPANLFGLFDMHGNVWEWCADWYHESCYAKSPPRDPKGAGSGTMRVVRGGSWRNHAATCRSAYRNALVPHNRDAYTGFRIVAHTTG